MGSVGIGKGVKGAAWMDVQCELAVEVILDVDVDGLGIRDGQGLCPW